ncbi:MAG: hypothetical protein AB8H80_13480 [Planctomycetota bacterium]
MTRRTRPIVRAAAGTGLAGALYAELAAYEGRGSLHVLEQLRDERPASAAVLRAALRLVRECAGAEGKRDSCAAEGASWLLLAWTQSEKGARWTFKLVDELLAAVPGCSGASVRLHLIRCLGLVPHAAEQALGAQELLCDGLEADRPFERAWCLDGLVRLAEQHPACAPVARLALAKGASDPAASVRARVRNLTIL